MDLERATSILEEAERAERLLGSAETERLAVLATFDPSRLTGRDGGDIMRLLCRRLVRRDGHDEAMLVERCRVDALSAMLRRGGTDELSRVRGTVEADYDTPLQRMVDAFVDGRPMPVDMDDENDLLAALEVGRWATKAIAQARHTTDVSIEPRRDELESRLTLLNVTRAVRRLVAAGCVGRERELARLHDYRTSPATGNLSDDPAMLVYGIGGIGKSTLVARFVMDLYEVSDPGERWAWAYVDLDRPTLSTGDPMVVLTDIIEQVSAQFSAERRTLRRFRDVAHLRIKGSGLESVDGALSHRDHAARFATVLRDIEIRSLVVVVDTVEELERNNPRGVADLYDLFAAFASSLPGFRLVVSGRGPARAFADHARPDRQMCVLPLADDAAVALLRHHVDQSTAASGQDVDDALAREIISLVGGIPLTVRLAAQVLVREGPGAVTDSALRARAMDRVRSEFVRGFLYQRILDHITVADPARTEELRQVARAGLALRWITPRLIERVLIPSIGLAPASPAEELFRELASEVALVENEGDVLRLREELRGPALAALALDDPHTVERVHRAAGDYFAADSSAGAVVERTYHQLALGHPVYSLDESTLRQLAPSVADFPAATAAIVQRALADPQALAASEDLAAWEQKTLYSADAALRAGQLDHVRALLDERTERTGGTELHRIESRLDEVLGDLAAATDAAHRELAAAGNTADAPRLAAATVRLSGLLERRRLPAAAGAVLQETADAALLTGRPDLRLELELNRMTLMERAGLLHDDDRWSSGLHVRALLQRSGPAALAANTAVVRLLAAAIGREEPERIRAAMRVVGLGHEEDTERVNALVTELARWDSGGPEPGRLARESGLRPQGSDAAAVTRAWTALAGLGTDAGILLDRVWTVAAPPEHVREALRGIYLWWGLPTEQAGPSTAGPPAFLTEFPLDWSRVETRELEDILLTAYPKVADIQELAASAGLDLRDISWASSNRRITRELLAAASRKAQLPRLVAAILDDSGTMSVHPRIRSLVGDDWLQAHDLPPQGVRSGRADG